MSNAAGTLGMAEVNNPPAIPDRVKTTPSTGPACRTVFNIDMIIIPKLEAATTSARIAIASSSGSPQSILKIRVVAINVTMICPAVVMKTVVNFPPRIMALEVGVVKRRANVPSSSSCRID